MKPNNIVELSKSSYAESVFFFGVSEKNGKRNHITTVGNPYTTELRGKHILIDRLLSKELPHYCYFKINKAIKKESCFVVTDGFWVKPVKATSEMIKGLNLVSRPDYTKPETIKYYAAKTKYGNIDTLLVTYEMNGYNGVYYDQYLIYDGKILNVENPSNYYCHELNQSGIDYSKVLFKDFERIQ